MTGLIVTVTGWTIPALDATPWPDVADLLDYWAVNPPLHLMVKTYLGIQDPHDDPPIESPEDLLAMIQHMSGGAVVKGSMR